jgi:LemA protein
VAEARPGLEIDMFTTLIVIGVIVAVVLFVVVGGYNRLVALDQRADQSFADIDVQLKQRQDLIPNLVETVKGYATHERGTLDAVTQARAAAAGATSVNDKVQAENMLTGALGRLFAVAEAYPDLKANTNFQQLQTELSDIENKLAAARRFFNNAVAEFNAGIQQFPAVLLAGAMGFHERTFFDVGADRAAVSATPQVKF